jgi:hypothetical protein
MLTRKRLIILGVVAVLAAAVVVGVARQRHCSWHQRLARGRLIDWQHSEWIRWGMRRPEVEAILGGPPGDFRTESVFYFAPTRPNGVPEGPWTASWMGDKGLVQVDFNDYGGACVVAYAPGLPTPRPPSLADRVMDWARRLWH